ncbi:putative apyrase 2 [Diplonema papillatum]|nr:putative apyrase 2 [Diplonema papillatum]
MSISPRLFVLVTVAIVFLRFALFPWRPALRGEAAEAEPAGESAQGASPSQWGLVFDAGSTGSRAHVFRVTDPAASPAAGRPSVREWFHGHDKVLGRDQVGEVFNPLLQFALSVIPAASVPHTRILVGATAGLRSRAPEEADRVLHDALSLLKRSPFAAGIQFDTADMLLSGDVEGASAWTSVNFLAGGLLAGDTSAILDVGGGSFQLVFEPTDADAASRLEGAAVSYHGTTHQVSIVSGDGLGVNQALQSSPDLARCTTYHTCRQAAADVLEHRSGRYAGAASEVERLYAFSFFHKLTDDDSRRAVIRRGDFSRHAEKVCVAPSAEATCPGLSYLDALLEFLGVRNDTRLTIAKKIIYNSEPMETAWPLGAFLRSL